ncbi:MAG: sensor domain-containing diguanylate cyclase [Pseudomonadota bacterium]
MNHLLTALAATVGDAEDLEGLARPLLELMETVTGLESTYLTTIDLDRGVQHVLYARNSKAMQIPEGLTVPWGDTLCKRALEEGRAYTGDVAACWGDSEAAQALGIQTYLSQPVRVLDGSVYGTLCAASDAKVQIQPDVLRVVGLFARLVAHQIDSEREMKRLKCLTADLTVHALTDPLTGIANRRGIMDRLERMLDRARREHGTVMVAFVDLDGFKRINDQHGHEAGDLFLCQMAKKLSESIRANDVLGRYGGDEFVIVTGAGDAKAFSRRIEQATTGRFITSQTVIDYAGASVGVAIASPDDASAHTLLSRADGAMYASKLARKQAVLNP